MGGDGDSLYIIIPSGYGVTILVEDTTGPQSDG